MFTGIIEDVGIVRDFRKSGAVSIITVETGMDLKDTKIGDSICVNGVCLTVVAIEGKSFIVEASPETVSRSTLKDIGTNNRVNLEKALAVGDRLGGHMVQGHVDGVGVIKRVDKDKDSLIIEIIPPDNVFRYIVDKGSVSVNGISLTVNSIADDSFTVNIIRHTAEKTNLLNINVGDEVNLEADIIGKYVERFLAKDKKEGEGLTLKKLAEEGYL